jgi:hypothetical protein
MDARSSRPGSAFYEVWEPRIGTEAARLLRQRSVFSLIMLGPLGPLVLIATKTGAYAVFAVIFWGLFATHLLVQRRNKRAIAVALSQHLGFPVASSRLPPFRLKAFDAWLAEVRNTRRAAEPGR